MTDRRPIAIVTGGGRGIGLGISRALAQTGWDLAIAGVRPVAELADIIRELQSFGGRVHYVSADVSNHADRVRLVKDVIGTLGTPSALVNNAGIAPRVRADLLEASEQSFEEIVRTNLQGPYFLTQLVANAMIVDTATPRRGIVFITSVSAEMASVNRGDYCVSKAGLSMAAKLFAVRLAEHRIPVYEIRPGIVATDMTAAVKDKYDLRIAGGLVPDARWGTPDDVGAMAALLLREDLTYATGTVVHVDGGLTIPRL
ncbi:MAG TPA: 3-ketoacyl-ACP reductase [Vicinamibacterales bacterium]|nr:3-ketoacyl-ACP reductase [Vicinamibacterales bacterium]